MEELPPKVVVGDCFSLAFAKFFFAFVVLISGDPCLHRVACFTIVSSSLFLYFEREDYYLSLSRFL